MPEVDPPRPLTGEEERVLRFLLSAGGDEAEPYLRQVPGLRVDAHCDCGCPSITFAGSGVGLEDIALASSPNFDPKLGGVVLVTQGDDQGHVATLDLEWTTNEPARAWPPLDGLSVQWRGLPEWFLDRRHRDR